MGVIDYKKIGCGVFHLYLCVEGFMIENEIYALLLVIYTFYFFLSSIIVLPFDVYVSDKIVFKERFCPKCKAS